MKIELDLPQVPEGWRFVGYQVPKKGQAVATHCGQFEKLLNDWDSTRALTFERIEPEDPELEEAKKLTGKWVVFKDKDVILKVRSVLRDSYSKALTFEAISQTGNLAQFYLRDFNPFPLPVWRCCESDKPKKEKRYAVRCKHDRGRYNSADYENLKWLDRWGTEFCGVESNYEWLDEGER